MKRWLATRSNVGGAVPGGRGARSDRGRSELRPDVCHAHAEGEDRSAGCAGPDRGQRARGLSAGASALGRPDSVPEGPGGADSGPSSLNAVRSERSTSTWQASASVGADPRRGRNPAVSDGHQHSAQTPRWFSRIAAARSSTTRTSAASPWRSRAGSTESGRAGGVEQRAPVEPAPGERGTSGDGGINWAGSPARIRLARSLDSSSASEEICRRTLGDPLERGEGPRARARGATIAVRAREIHGIVARARADQCNPPVPNGSPHRTSGSSTSAHADTAGYWKAWR
jgi:hypothetical protein